MDGAGGDAKEQKIREAYRSRIKAKKRIVNALGGYDSDDFAVLSDEEIQKIEKDLKTWFDQLVEANGILQKEVLEKARVRKQRNPTGLL